LLLLLLLLQSPSTNGDSIRGSSSGSGTISSSGTVTIDASSLQTTTSTAAAGVGVGGATPITRTIVLLGDSLIYKPCTQHNLIGLLTAGLPNGSYTFSNQGRNGCTVSCILDYVTPVLQQYKPAGVILYWDSDVSNINESTMSNEAITELRANYSDDVFRLCREILSTGALLALAGPGVLGEAAIGLPDRFFNKSTMLDAYR